MKSSAVCRNIYAGCALILVMILSIAPTQADAQQRGFQYMIDAGVAYPIHDHEFADRWKVGISLSAGLGYRTGSNSLLVVRGEVNSLPLDGETILRMTGLDTEGSTAEEGNASIYLGTVNLKYAFSRSRSGEAPFLIAGAGIARFTAGDILINHVVDNITYVSIIDGYSETALALNAGAGFNIHLGKRTHLYVEGRYVLLFTDTIDVHFIPLRMGVAFR